MQPFFCRCEMRTVISFENFKMLFHGVLLNRAKQPPLSRYFLGQISEFYFRAFRPIIRSMENEGKAFERAATLWLLQQMKEKNITKTDVCRKVLRVAKSDRNKSFNRIIKDKAQWTLAHAYFASRLAGEDPAHAVVKILELMNKPPTQREKEIAYLNKHLSKPGRRPKHSN